MKVDEIISFLLSLQNIITKLISMKRNFFIMSVLFVCLNSFGQQAKIDIAKDKCLSASNYVAHLPDMHRSTSVTTVATALAISSARAIMTNLTASCNMPTVWAS
jgi:hypothetical protein